MTTTGEYWLLTTELAPQASNGISTYCTHTIAMMQQHGHAVRIFVHDNTLAAFMEETIHKGTPLVRFNCAHAPENLGGYGPTQQVAYALYLVVVACIKNHGKPQYMEAQDYNAIAYFLLQQKRLLHEALQDSQIIITLHSPWMVLNRFSQQPAYKYPEYWIGELERFCLRAADTVLAPSAAMLNEVAKGWPLNDINTHVVPNPYEAAHHTSPQREGIFYFGRTQYLKGADLIAAAMEELWHEGVEEPLHFIGSDQRCWIDNVPFGKRLAQKHAHAHAKGLLRFSGKLPQAEAHAALESAKIVVMPSRFESFSYALVESLALGRICITANTGGQPEILGTKNPPAFLFSPHEQGALATCLRTALALTPQEMEAMGKRATQRVHEYLNYSAVYEKKMTALHAAPTQQKHMFPCIRPRRITLPEATLQPPPHNTLLSIIIPLCDNNLDIENTLRNLHTSDYHSKEIIIAANSNLPEKSLDRLKKLQQHYPFTLTTVKNATPATIKNAGAAMAQGTFLAFIPADMMVAPHFYNRAITVLQQYDNVACAGACVQYSDRQSPPSPSWNPEPPVLLLHNIFHGQCMVAKTTLFHACGGFDPDMAYGFEDYELLVRFLAHGLHGVALPEPLALCTAAPGKEHNRLTNTAKLYLYNLITQKHAALFQEFGADIANLAAANGSGLLCADPCFDTKHVRV